jgi:hypothetical protein
MGKFARPGNGRPRLIPVIPGLLPAADLVHGAPPACNGATVGGTMIRALRWTGLVLALAIASFGAWAVNQPLRPHGPFGFSVASPIGALALAIGLTLLRALGRTAAVYGLAALLIALFAGYNFYSYPPIPDGAYFLARYGRTEAGELWPASAAWHVIGFAGVAWSLSLMFDPAPLKGWRGVAEVALLVLLMAGSAALFELFTQMLPGVAAPWRWGAGWLTGLIAVTAGLRSLGRRNAFARLAAAFCALLTLLTAGTLVLYQVA